MSKIKILLKNNILNTYKIKAMSGKKKIITGLLIIYVVSILMIGIGSFVSNLFKMMNDMGMSSYYLVIIFSVASLFAFIFSIFSAKSFLFDNKDNDLLLSMPIKKSDILASRILMVIGYNFLVGLVFIIPGIVIYIKNIELSCLSYITIILLVLFFSIIPSILACLFGYLVAYLTSKVKHKSLFELLFYTIFILGYFLLTYGGNNILKQLFSNPKLLDVLLKTLFLPLYLINYGIINNNIFYIFLFVLLNLVVLCMFIIVLKNSYFKIISRLNASINVSNYKMHFNSSRPVKKALLIREFKKYFSSAIYVFNTIFGEAAILIFSVASFIYSKEQIIDLVNTGENMNSFSLVLMALLFVNSLSLTTNSSISIERDNYWILKMLPVRIRDILYTKVRMNRILLIPSCLLALVLFKISGYVTIIEMLLLGVLAIIYGFFITNFGLIVNLLFPNLNARNDAVIVKQSVASMVGIMGGIAICMGYVFIAGINGLSNLRILLILSLISLALYIISAVVINYWGTKRFMEIN